MTGEVTAFVEAANQGDAGAAQVLFARAYGEFKRVARKQLAGAQAPTLDTTGRVHEAYLKLAGSDARALGGRVHFFALAAKAMRQIVIDRARAPITTKRGGENLHIVSIDEALRVSDDELGPDALLRIDRALTALEHDEPRLAQLVELRFFSGLSIAEIAALQSISERTFDRDWRRAKALLHVDLHPEA